MDRLEEHKKSELHVDANMAEAPKDTRQSTNCPVHEYIKPLTDSETDIAFQDWKVHVKNVRLRLSRGASRHARTNPRNKVPPNLTFHAFWAYMNKHSSNPKIKPYLYGEMDKIDNIQYECHIKDRKTKVKQQQYMVTWADTYIRKEHIPLAAKDGYIAKDTRKCPVIRRIHGPVVGKRVLRTSWQPLREPAETANIPMGMKEAFDDARQKAGCINLAKDNHVRLDQHKTNLDRQGYWPALQDKETSALLLEPGLAKSIHINTLETVNPDQDIVATGTYTISMPHAQPLNYNPTSRSYFSLYPEDRLFGANVDAYSCKWQGGSEVHPKHEPARPRQIRLDTNGDCTLQGLYPPKHYTKAVYAAPAT